MISIIGTDKSISKPIVSSGNVTGIRFKSEFLCDNTSDESSLPTDYPAGSTSITAQTGKIMILNAAGSWVEI